MKSELKELMLAILQRPAIYRISHNVREKVTFWILVTLPGLIAFAFMMLRSLFS